MIRGLMEKSLRDTLLGTLLFAFAMALVMALLTAMMPHVLAGLDDLLDRMPFVKKLVSVMLGVDMNQQLTTGMMQAILWVHPIVLALIWAHEISFCTRLPAGEIDRGTIDVLLSLPVSRRAIYTVESGVWLASGALILLAGWAGHLATNSALPLESRPTLADGVRVLVNLLLVYTAVGAVTLLVSAFCSRRSTAVGVMMAVVMASFLIRFLAQFWTPAEQIAFLGVLQYYRPADMLASHQMPWGDIAILSGVTVTAWAAGAEAFARRSICTV